MTEKLRPRVNVANIIRKDGKVLVMKRLDDAGKDIRGFPSGTLEFRESIIACSQREMKEELDITLKNCQVIGFGNEIYPTAHWLAVLVVSDYESGEMKNREPDKCFALEWVKREDLPSPMFLSDERLKESDFHPFENVKVMIFE